LNPKGEAQLICNTLQKTSLGHTYIPGDRVYPGLGVDMKTAISNMREADYRHWKEVEWPAFYISFLLEEGLQNLMEIKVDGKRVCFIGDHIWDVRTKASNFRDSWVILTDVRNTDKIFNAGKGFGLVIIFAYYNYDTDGSLWQWHEDLKGRESDYVKKIEAEGRPRRRRKATMFLIEGNAYFFPTLRDFQSGISGGWLKNDVARNWRNQNENKRNPKYAIDFVNIPAKNKVLRHDFNFDLEEFDENLLWDE